MKRNTYYCFSVLIFILFFTNNLVAQQYSLSGTVTDAETKELLIGANIWVEQIQNGTITDFDGRYNINLKSGIYDVKVSFVGFETQEFNITIADAPVVLNVEMGGSQVLKEIMVTADIARERETPVAFSNIPTIKLQEELASQDMPMVLNSTPGAYATQSGGGDGDARITIRGFNQRNVAVMLDGIPVNDMENGWVYWSNWFGLDLVTQTMQVQRGLGASKLSIPSVGGTINILTKGIDAKKGIQLRQEIGNDGFLRTTLGLTSGRLENGWGISLAGSYKRGNGWVDGTFTKGLFYYARIDKQMGKHLISLSGFGAPQQHGQRPFTREIAMTDTQYALDNGVPQNVIDDFTVGNNGFANMGRKYNNHWGYRDGELYNTRKNYYHKPQFSLRHSWQASNKLFWSNVAYLSIGNGGGTAPAGKSFPIDTTGQINFGDIIKGNEPNAFNGGKANYIMRSGINNHFWYGLLSTFNYGLTEKLTLSGGLDGRYYKGGHYREVYDLMGADYFSGEGNNYQIPPSPKLVVGDKYAYHYDGFVRWGGLFGLLEYKVDKISAFVNLSGAMSGYTIEDYMKPKMIELNDTTLYVAYGDTVIYSDQTYTLNSPEAKNQSLDWINIPSYTAKMGASYKLTNRVSVFANAGYLSKAQKFSNVINTNRFGERIREFNEHPNEKIIAFELGSSYGSPLFSVNLNTYYTRWENKPLDSPPSVPIDSSDPESERITINVPGIDALHTGVELDLAWEPIKLLAFEGLFSLGDWRWTSAETALVQLRDSTYSFSFDAAGVPVGDAAQFQLGGLVKVKPVKGLYISLRGNYFGKNYADFQPEDLKDEDAGRESWKLPDYALFNFHAGYSIKVNKMKLGLRFNVLNLLDTVYISDATNNNPFNDPAFSNFDAKSAAVHFGQGRRWSTAFTIGF